MPFAKVFHVKNEDGMRDCAAALIPMLVPGSIIALHGDLGAGKTTLARAILREVTGKPNLDVPSPTFTLVQTYDTPLGEIWHCDFYRLKLPDDVYELGWEDALATRAILLLEWAENLGPLLPANTVHITITIPPEGGRHVEVKA